MNTTTTSDPGLWSCRAGESSRDDRIGLVQKLPAPIELIRRAPATPEIARFVAEARASIYNAITGADPRLLVVVGPCSIHDPDAALEYASVLARLRRALGSELLIVMRVYLEKPRTCIGWKGFINDPFLNGSFRVDEGLRRARRLLLEINAIGVPAATEFVDPTTPRYVGDLISWACVGARSVESQVHRELASGLACPVGFKNSTAGDIRVAVNGIRAARVPQRVLGVTHRGRLAVMSTAGNPQCHIVLRGSSAKPNHDDASIRAAAGLLESAGVPTRVMVDCGHGNCQGDYRRQMSVADDLLQQRRHGSPHVCGLMLESNLLPGSQALVEGLVPLPGLSITDPCLGLADTVVLLSRLAGREVTADAV